MRCLHEIHCITIAPVFLVLPGCALWTPTAMSTGSSFLGQPPPKMVLLDSDGMETAFIQKGTGQGGTIAVRAPLSVIEAAMPESQSLSLERLLQKLEYCKLKITDQERPSVPSNSEHTVAQSGLEESSRTAVAGRIVSVGGGVLVLGDVVAIDETNASHPPASAMSKIPYISRLVKTSGVLVRPISIPGEVRINLESIASLESITASGWPSFRQQGFQRIGVDFDFTGELR